MSLLEYDDDRELFIDECECASIEGTANAFTARGKTKSLFDLRFEVAFVATVRHDNSKLCEGKLVCEASNEGGKPSLEAKAHLTTQVRSRDHHQRVLGVVEAGLKAEVMRAVMRFAEEMASKAASGA